MIQIIQCRCLRSLMIMAVRNTMSWIFQTLSHWTQASWG